MCTPCLLLMTDECPPHCAAVLDNTHVAASIVVAASAGSLVDAFGGGLMVMHYVANAEGCQQYQAAWTSSDIDGPDVIGCNEEELNEYV